ncbi:hypothetical protein KVT40_000861 [Elsinoe batatas]|uniref:Rhodopsin domain-containing protein n=1 Tax=Elsinoe batatas TaxID=2601811 RepID=A0A8K0KZ28_9PEZI|nr:hypothetical protein KVT40_009379 [Elsinoe batatas]KAG8631721.1 hypothetical protein KVT40_000861 [Elsinoe batatas]
MLAESDQLSTLVNNHTWAIYLGCLVPTLLLATIALSLRIWVRIKITRSFRMDDYILIAAHAINFLACGLWLHIRRLGTSVPDDSPESMELLSTPIFVSLVLYVLAGIVVKVSIGLWFPYTARSWIQPCFVIVPTILYILACTVSLFLIVFRCGLPVSLIKLQNTTECTVGPTIILYASWVVASLNSICDWTFAGVALYMVIRSKAMTALARIMAYLLIGLAVVGSIVSVSRLTFLGAAKFGPQFMSNPGNATAFLLSLIETFVAIITISLATLQPLLAVAEKRWPSLSSGSGTRASFSPSLKSQGKQPAFPTLERAETLRSTTSSSTRIIAPTDRKVRLDSETLGRLGILPDVSDGESDEEEDGGLIQFLPRRSSKTMPQLPAGPLGRISEVATPVEEMPAWEEESYIGKMG